MLLTGHLRSLPARSFQDFFLKKLQDSLGIYSLVIFSIKKCFHLGCHRSGSGSSSCSSGGGSNITVVVVVVVVAAVTGAAVVAIVVVVVV